MRKAQLAILTFVLLGAIPEFVPMLANYRIIAWSRIATLLEFSAASPHEPAVPPLSARNLQEPTGSLDSFLTALQRTDGPVRILHYGDSPATADQITADARDLLQQQFGDAGHGFILIARPWAWYRHRGTQITSQGWAADPASMNAGDGKYGLGGVSFTGKERSWSRVRFQAAQNSVEIAYLQKPGGGTLRVSLDGREAGIIETNGALESRFHEFSGAFHDVELTVVRGEVRMFGIEARRSSRGVIYSSLGLNGAYVSVLAKMFNREHWKQQLQHYRPDLVILNYGTNESVYREFLDQKYELELRGTIARVRDAVPQASILVMSPMDRGERIATGEIATVPGLPRLVAMQQRIARSAGCAFFDTFDAMGGAGTMNRWYAAEPRLVTADFIHPTAAGARAVGNLLFRGLMDRYRQSAAMRASLVR